MCHRGSFREDIYKKCVLSKKDNNNKFNLLESIVYFYCSKNYSGKKEEKKKDNKGIREIKNFIQELYFKFGEYNKKVE